MTTSEMLAVLLKRLGGGPQIIKLDELKSFGTDLPTVLTLDEAAGTITLEIDTKFLEAKD